MTNIGPVSPERLHVIRDILNGLVRHPSQTDPSHRIPVSTILKAVAAEWRVPYEELVAKAPKSRRVAVPRFAAYNLVRAIRQDLSLPEIGRKIGGRDHTTILSGIKQWQSKWRAEEGHAARYRNALRKLIEMTKETSGAENGKRQ